MKILVVDDTRIILSVIEAILSQEHQDVITAGDGREGCRAFHRHAPEMVITDIEMPWQDGLSMMQSIRRTHPEIRTIYMTGNPGPYQQRLRDEAHRYAARLLLKPFTRSDLLRTMTDVVTFEAPDRQSADLPCSTGAAEPSLRKPTQYDLASLSAASFQRERRYEKMDRPFIDDHHAGGIRAGGRG
jgi:DNA-binding NtrC family response regulator